ncbi:MAG TPA: hypothetical protein VKG91_08180 [Roseiarcus sp.]|nr:hypothetical protein [Roseiarcus sp.]
MQLRPAASTLRRMVISPRIMEDCALEPVEVHAVFPAGRAASPAARAFIDYLAPQL